MDTPLTTSQCIGEIACSLAWIEQHLEQAVFMAEETPLPVEIEASLRQMLAEARRISGLLGAE